MKIAVLAEIINRKSGARAPLEIAKALKNVGHDVTVFAYAFDLEKEAVKKLHSIGIHTEIIHVQKLLAPLVLYQKLKGNFDILSYHAKLPFLIGALLSGLPIIRTYHGTQFDPILDKQFPKKPNPLVSILNHLANVYLIIVETILLRSSDKILAISRYTKQEVKRIYKFNADYVYYGTSLCPKHQMKKGQKKKDIIILSVSRIIPYKGFHHLLSVFQKLQAKYPYVQLVIAGSSPDPKYLSYLKKHATDRVLFKINLPDEKLIDLYKEADIYATFDRYMFFGMPLLEASSFSLPIVALAKCAAPEIVTHGRNGFLAKNEASFLTYLERLVRNATIRKRMGDEAYLISKSFSWKTFGEKYSQLFAETIKKAEGGKLRWSKKILLRKV